MTKQEHSFQPYKLSCTLIGHSKDVRCLDSMDLSSSSSSGASSSQPGTSSAQTGPYGPGLILVSGSRDFSARQWLFTPPRNFQEVCTFAGHGNFVSSICIVPPSNSLEQTLIATGCTDTTIRLFTLNDKQPIGQLIGHSGNVSALRSHQSGAGAGAHIISGSWDSTVRRWEVNGKCEQIMTGHEAAVWDVEIAPNGQTLSASADKSIKSWSCGKCVQTFIGHTDCVRGIAIISDTEFVSCANDATIRRWALLTADCLQIFYGHSNFIYAIKFFNGTVFTASEDKSVKVWNLDKSQDPLQSIVLPAQSNWCLSILSNGDVAVGCSDASIRVFTNNSLREAPEDQLKAFSEEVATSSIPSKSTIGDLKVDELPGPEALLQPGKREGQSLMIREGKDLAFCYQWSAAKREWEKVGQILGGSGGTQVTSGKQLYRGKEYDYVFSVKLDEDKDALKLPYNVKDDPWHVARQFILDNELDPLFLDQVANFIINNTAGVQLGRSTGNVDPFTGTGSTEPQASQPHTPSNSDPHNKPGSNRGNFDPYTGFSATNNTDTSLSKYFPLKHYLVLFKTNFGKDMEKIVEFNSRTTSKIPDATIEALKRVNESVIGIDDVTDVVLSCLLSWEDDYVFPFFDLCVHFTNYGKFCQTIEPEMTKLLLRINALRHSSSKSSQTMALRFLANLSGSELGRGVLMNRPELLQIVESYANITIAPAALALSTLVLNITVWAHSSQSEMNYLSLVPVLNQLLTRDVFDEETCFRALVATGTLCCDNEVMREACKGGSNLVLLIENVNSNVKSTKVNECCSLLTKLFKS